VNRRAGLRWTLAAVTTAVVAVGGYALSPWGLGSTPPERAERVVIATGDPGGLDQAYAHALAQASAYATGGGFTIESVATAGQLDSLRRLGTGDITFAFASVDVVREYLRSSPTAPPLRAVARLYDAYLHLVVPAQLPVHSLADLRGRRVGVGGRGSGTTLAADRILSDAGIDPTHDIARLELGLTDAVAAMLADKIDAFFVVDGLAAPALTRLAGALPVRMVDLAGAATSLSVDPELSGASYQVGNMPARSYPGMAGPTVTVAVPTLLLTIQNADPATVRRLTGLLFETARDIATAIPAIGQVDRHVAIFTGTVPLHDGASDYYRSTKIAMLG
jgi:TRAP transporter TAXI family solute receptor